MAGPVFVFVVFHFNSRKFRQSNFGQRRFVFPILLFVLCNKLSICCFSFPTAQQNHLSNTRPKEWFRCCPVQTCFLLQQKHRWALVRTQRNFRRPVPKTHAPFCLTAPPKFSCSRFSFSIFLSSVFPNRHGQNLGAFFVLKIQSPHPRFCHGPVEFFPCPVFHFPVSFFVVFQRFCCFHILIMCQKQPKNNSFLKIFANSFVN